MTSRNHRGSGATAGLTRISRRASGFTMVELIVVIVLAGILGALAVSRFFDRSQFDAISFADQAASAIRFAQKEAIAQNRDPATQTPLYVRFDGASISLCYGTTWPCPANAQVPAPFAVNTDGVYCTSTRWYCISLPSTIGYIVSLGAVSAAAPRYFYFDALGRPYDSSGAALASVTTVTVSGGAQTATVSIEPETGYVH